MSARNPRVDRMGPAKAGSQRQIQIYVNQFADELSRQVTDALPSLKSVNGRLRWVSPLERENFVEYYDQGFLRAVDHPELTDKLSEFWPQGGPHWDALAVVEFPNEPDGNGVILVEAKSHRIEIFGNGCKAEGQRLKQIESALAKTREWLGMRCGYTKTNRLTYEWTGPLYQYANRLAHLYFLKEVAKVPAWLVNVYFANDPYRPTTREQWENFLPEVKWALLGQEETDNNFVEDLFLEANKL